MLSRLLFGATTHKLLSIVYLIFIKRIPILVIPTHHNTFYYYKHIILMD